MIPNFIKTIKQISWWRISQSEIRNSAAAEKNWNRKARAGKNFYPVGSQSDSFGAFPPTPFLFARPSGKVFIKIRSPDFRQKKFEHQSKNTAKASMHDMLNLSQFFDEEIFDLVRKPLFTLITRLSFSSLACEQRIINRNFSFGEFINV